VRESNQGAIAFYERLGFRRVGWREGYYQQPVEAALILEHSTNNPQLGTE
jgi:ribosomal protein S18 acetylase RimI-like enzyme